MRDSNVMDLRKIGCELVLILLKLCPVVIFSINNAKYFIFV